MKEWLLLIFIWIFSASRMVYLLKVTGPMWVTQIGNYKNFQVITIGLKVFLIHHSYRGICLMSCVIKI